MPISEYLLGKGVKSSHTHTASELDFNSALTTKDHRGYAVGCLSPMIEVVGDTSIPPTGYDVCSTIGLIID